MIARALILFSVIVGFSSTVLAQPAHDGGPTALAPARTIASWGPGTFLESIAVASDGSTFIANHDDGAVDRVQDGRIERFAKLPHEVTGLLLRPDGGLLATGREETGGEKVYAISTTGAVTELTTVPGAGFLNGMTWLKDGVALIADL
jgi:hypothetical protein